MAFSMEDGFLSLIEHRSHEVCTGPQKKYMQQLEARLRQCELQETDISEDVQLAPQWAVDDDIKFHLQSMVDPGIAMGQASCYSPILLTGKASPYPMQADDEEMASLEDDTEGTTLSSESGTIPPSMELSISSDYSKLLIFNQVMQTFWEIFNPKFNSGISMHAGPRETPSTRRTNFTNQASSKSKRLKYENQEDEEDPLSGKGNGRAPKRPKPEFLSQVDNGTLLKFACPFRKHNPRKYNVHQFQSCALSSFDSIARVK